jgi:hypothetical protein
VRLPLAVCRRRLILDEKQNGIMLLHNANTHKNHHLYVMVFVLTHSDKPCEALNRP